MFIWSTESQWSSILSTHCLAFLDVVGRSGFKEANFIPFQLLCSPFLIYFIYSHCLPDIENLSYIKYSRMNVWSNIWLLYIKENDFRQILTLRRSMPLIQCSLIMTQFDPEIRFVPILLSACEWVKIVLFSIAFGQKFFQFEENKWYIVTLEFCIDHINILSTKDLIGWNHHHHQIMIINIRWSSRTKAQLVIIISQ